MLFFYKVIWSKWGGSTIKKLLLISLTSFLLVACAADNDSTNSSSEDVVEATEEETKTTSGEIEDEEEKINVASEMTTFFKPEITELRELSDKDLQLYDELLNAVTENAGSDREAISMIALEKGEDPDELWETWLEITDAVMYGHKGSSVITDMDHSYLIDQILSENIEENEVYIFESSTHREEEDRTSITSGKVRINGEEEYNFRIKVRLSEDYREAEMLELSIDGENIEL